MSVTHFITWKILSLPLPVFHHWGYGIIFLAAVLEAFPLFGSFVPGHTLIILAGFFAREGILDVGDLLWVATLGTVIGDIIGYSIGKKVGQRFFTTYGKYVFLKPEFIEKTKELVKNHTGKALILGRTNPLTRALAPFMAGASDIRFIKFLAFTIIGGMLWAASGIIIGYLFGESFEFISKYAGRVVISVIIAAVILLGLYRFIKRIFRARKIHNKEM